MAGDFFLFGGTSMLRAGLGSGNRQTTSVTKSDVYQFSAIDMSVRLVQTTGHKPPPRIGCACFLVGEGALLVWGGRSGWSAANETVRSGKTMTYPHWEAASNDALYLLDLSMS